MLTRKVGSLNIPVIGLGTYDLLEYDMKTIIQECVLRGVNFLDSANRYDNEFQLGQAIKKIGLNRSDIIMGTKLSYKQQITQTVEMSVDESLKKLQMDYIDLYLIHSPKSMTYCKDWLELQNEKEKGKIRELGVSNFSINQLKELYNVSGKYPVINQIEVNLAHFPYEVIEFCHRNDIVVQASCPLRRMDMEITREESVQQLMERYDKTYPQIALRWLFQKGIVSIPKMSSTEHLLENIDIFDFALSEKELQIYSSLQKG